MDRRGIRGAGGRALARVAVLLGASVAACSGGGTARTTGDAGASSGGASGTGGQADGGPASFVTLGWSDETAGRGLSGISTSCRNVSFGDLDGDGAPDLIVPDSAQVSFFHNDGHGNFTPWNVVKFQFSGLQQCAMALADFDGDGKLDVALGLDLSDTPVGILFNDGDGNFTPVFANIDPPVNNLRTFCLGTVENVGASPILFACTAIDGVASMIPQNGCGYGADGVDVECPVDLPKPTSRAWQVSGRKLTASADPGLAFSGNSQGLGVTDFDGDGHDDMFLAIDFHTQAVLRGGAATFTDASSAWHADVFGHGMGLALGDVDEDGNADALVATIGGFIDLKGLGKDGFTRRGKSSPFETHRRNIWPWSVLFANLDNDGHLDLYSANEFASAKDEDPLQWLLTLGGDADYVGAFHTVVFTHGASGPTEGTLPYEAVLPKHGRSQSVALADVDGDGVLEIAMPIMRADHSDVSDVVIGKLSGVAVGHGLTVRFSGAPVPTGTKVALSCGGSAHTRTLYGAEGTGAAARREAHFGCGDAKSFDSLTVSVPGKAPITVPAGALDRAITVPL